ncbi:M20/M25/M40 family metallo-hydrolase [Herbidospora sp. NEAU-GS84]|uniref:M20/M25/M40 family metallo-hydrolase n=1 Tax=Herbidospora solisilvae TaxID=2696284 RepID=A0A7C9NF95_9ACTN|nr:M20/M25/M40 family metallo-hydrolase [Herbidospora solisilvae]NAS20852.1 M20/M25/M40 family metallo-hydrolase [Herbidospora solisilvae]
MSEAAKICSELIRIDTTNPGPGEREAAEYVAGLLSEAGLSPVIVESAPRRASVICRVPGDSPDALLIHGHLDVVPADPADWAVHPFSGEIADGYVHGRGAVDMKGSLAMTLAWVRQGVRPRRDLVLAFLADEESTGEFGSRYVVSEHADLFEGCSEAISESGGFSVTMPSGVRVYPIGVGERGTAWMKVTARGVAGHGSKPPVDNPVAELARALTRVADHEWPIRLTPAVSAMIGELSGILGMEIDPANLSGVPPKAAALFKGTIRNSTNPTMMNAGYKINVIPGTAEAGIDGRFVPGFREEFLDTLDRLLGPRITREFINFEDAPSAPTSGLFHELGAALTAMDPTGRPVPYVMTGGTDAKSFARLGIKGYGFAPLLLPPDLDYFALFHGIDERVPVEGLEFGVQTLNRLLATPH